jgi:hypothetical protein
MEYIATDSVAVIRQSENTVFFYPVLMDENSNLFLDRNGAIAPLASVKGYSHMQKLPQYQAKDAS